MINITLITLSAVSFFALISDNLSKKHSTALFVFLTVCLILVAGFRNGESMPDYASYMGYYSYILDGQFSYFIEISFVSIVKLSNFLLADNPIILFIIYAVLGVSLKSIAIKKLSPLFFYSLVIYVSNYFIVHEMIQIRAGVASGFILLSIVPLENRSFKNFLFLIGLATLFHYSSIIFIALWFLRARRFNVLLYFSLIPLAYFLNLFVDFISILNLIVSYIPFGGIVQKLLAYSQAREDLIVNPFGIYPITRVIILLFFLTFIHKIQRNNKYSYILLKMYALGIFAYIAFAMFPTIAVRISYTLLLSEIIIIPSLIYTIKGYYSPRLIVISYAFLAFFMNVFFTTYFVWSL